jgi:hypothetical protein
MLIDFDEKGLKIRQLCERLSLQTSVTKTAAFNGSLSNQDYAQRMRLVIPVSNITGNAVFTLQGSDDEGSNYYAISLVADDGTESTTQTISATATGNDSNSYLITRLYEKYRVQLISIGTTVTYSAYMIEEVYTVLHRYRTLANIYRSLMASGDDVYMNKFQDYLEKYERKLADGRFRVDYTDDDTISETEGDRIISNIRFRP